MVAQHSWEPVFTRKRIAVSLPVTKKGYSAYDPLYVRLEESGQAVFCPLARWNASCSPVSKYPMSAMKSDQ